MPQVHKLVDLITFLSRKADSHLAAFVISKVSMPAHVGGPAPITARCQC